VDLSTFSKASKNRDYQAFNQIYLSLNQELKKRKGKREHPLSAIDSTSRLFGVAQRPLRSTLTLSEAEGSTVITLTSKLF